MSKDDKPTRAEVNRREPDPYSDRQNLAGNQATLDERDVSYESDIEEYVRQDTADAPADIEMPRNHDDHDPYGDGVYDTPITRRYEDMADRDDLARRLEELAADAYDWVGRSDDPDAQYIYDTIVDLSQRVGNPPEETIKTQPGPVPGDRDEAGS